MMPIAGQGLQDYLVRFGFSLLPVLAFLLCLVFLDSYKLVRMADLVKSILLGCAAAVAGFIINSGGFTVWRTHEAAYASFAAPVIEEALKAACVFWLISSNRVGFMVDAAICGFAIGTGFALLENTYYAEALRAAHLMTWVIRGFGTAVMHGGTTAIVAIICTSSGNSLKERWRAILTGVVVAISIHILYNASPLGPTPSALAVLIGLPVTMVLIFVQSERQLQRWLSEGMDADIQLLASISAGTFSETHAGSYLKTLKDRFAPEVVADMFCVLQLSLELSMRAKGELLTREAGIDASVSGPDLELKSKFEEMDFLNRSIGTTGKRALAPLLATRTRDIWEMRLLRSAGGGA